MKTNMTTDSPVCHNNTDLKCYYAITYTFILVPGLIGNVLALWVFYGYMRETKRAVIFMINLAIADLAQVLSLPLRIFYYLSGIWHFGGGLCMFCFYLKYVNMYASIYFLVCISVRRFLFLMYPFRFSDCKRIYDVYISIIGWVVVCIGCLPFPLLRLNQNDTNMGNKCFVDLPVKDIDLPLSIAMMTLGELFGFVTPLLIILYCSWKTILSLKEKNSVSHDLGEKKKALKMILTCAVVFLICFAPYHISFPLDFFVKTKKIEDQHAKNVISIFHAVALCLASLNSCVDPVIYYFTTDEFRRRLSRQDLQDSTQLRNKGYAKKAPQSSVEE
ncbi:PREDICTED: probable G-protein coupled receptor 174 [Crocodylus porosus]|uniref:probable G-protein coupled receptor 174 n=1 Tax=Crocodylus porosus TaxID=8502 RepID=UPI00093BA606|nr:PREDICTED: probable G-protein coupled receptor 174 [Crocodylus porosus]